MARKPSGTVFIGQQINMGGSRGLYEDVLHYCILPRLPTKDLIRLKCVSRSWHRLISRDLYFIHLHSQRNCSSLLFMESGQKKHHFFLSLVSQDPRFFGIPRSSFEIQVDRSYVVALCSGLICLFCRVGDAKKLYIGNPVLRDWRLLPHFHSLSEYCPNYGLAVEVGKSAISYKLVLLEITPTENGSKIFKFNVLSSKSGKWEVAKTKTILSWDVWSPVGQTIYVNGVLYWLFRFHSCLLWFDAKDGNSGFRPLPPGSKMCQTGQVGRGIGELTFSRISRGKIEIWSMDQSSIWTKKHSISLKTMTESNPELFGSLCHVKPLRWKVIARHDGLTTVLMPFEGGADVFFCMGGYLFSYDMETGEVEKKSGYLRQPKCLFSYKNCLVPLPIQC